MKCKNCDLIESNIIKKFKIKYNQRTDYGIEYFEGYDLQMIDDIIELCK